MRTMANGDACVDPELKMRAVVFQSSALWRPDGEREREGERGQNTHTYTQRM